MDATMRTIRDLSSPACRPGRVVLTAAANRRRSTVRQCVVFSMLFALPLASTLVLSETFKCVDAAGKTSYQADPCPPAADATLKVQAPAAPGTGAREQVTPPPPATAPVTTSGASPGGSRAPKARMPSEADFRGPRETWERLGAAVRRGDKDAALKELTPSARVRLASAFDTMGSKSAPLNAEDLGSIRSVMLAGEGLATITLMRNKADGTYMHQVNLIRDADGKWRIDNM